MKKVILFIAISLDGYIADGNGQVDWLNGQDPTSIPDSNYDEFMKTIDTVVLGWNTYHQIVTELSPNQWVYNGISSFVVTHKKLISTSEVQFVNENPCELVTRLKQQRGKNIWICGGANLAQQLIRENLIDQFYISVIPILLGKGVPLFGQMEQALPLKLIKTQTSNGITGLIYERR